MLDGFLKVKGLIFDGFLKVKGFFFFFFVAWHDFNDRKNWQYRSLFPGTVKFFRRYREVVFVESRSVTFSSVAY